MAAPGSFYRLSLSANSSRLVRRVSLEPRSSAQASTRFDPEISKILRAPRAHNKRSRSLPYPCTPQIVIAAGVLDGRCMIRDSHWPISVSSSCA